MQIDHDTSGNQFVAHLDAGDAVLAYSMRDDRLMDLMHTQVPSSARGEGVGDQLVAHAVGFARDHGMRIVASCPFVRHWLSEHPEHAEIAAS